MNEIDDLIVKFLAGDITRDESHILKDWLKNSPGNREYFNSFRDVWLASALLGRVNEPAKKSRTLGVIREWAKIAAVFAFALLLGALGYRTFFNTSIIAQGKNDPVTIESKRGAMSSVTLPDGSRAWLNAESKITYGNGYNTSLREIELIGEAYFDVVTNPSKPFVVKAGNLEIKALGTSFNVKAYPEDGSVTTTLVNGHVIIEGRDNKNKDFEIELQPNQTITYFNDQQDYIAHLEETTELNSQSQGSESLLTTRLEDLSIIKQDQVKTELFTSWKDKNWVIEQQSLENLTRDMERRYDVIIEFNSESIRKYRFSGTIQNETLEQILYILHNTLPLKYTMEKGRIVIDEDRTKMKEFNRE
jgi:transmembrane sensor